MSTGTSTVRHAAAPTSAPRTPRVVLLGHFGAGNLGNDASVQAVAGMLERAVPGVRLVVVCRNPEVVQEELGLDARWIHAPRPPASRQRAGLLGRAARLPYRLADLRHVVRTVGDADLVVVPGTGILDDFGGDRSYSWPAVLLTWFAAARLRGVPVAMVGIGAGPVSSRSTRRSALAIARMASHQSYRDPGSRSFMVSLGVSPRRAHRTADVVFSRNPRGDDPAPSPRPAEDRPLAVVAVMDYRGWRPSAESDRISSTYLSGLGDLVEWLLARGYRVRLLTADHTGDEAAMLRLAGSVRAAAPGLADDALTTAVAADFDDAVRLTADARLVVATRYHSVVAALLNGVPVVSLGYARKNVELLERVGLADCAQDAETTDGELLRRQIEQLERDHAARSAEVRRGVALMRRDLDADQQTLGTLARPGRRTSRVRRRRGRHRR